MFCYWKRIIDSEDVCLPLNIVNIQLYFTDPIYIYKIFKIKKKDNMNIEIGAQVNTIIKIKSSSNLILALSLFLILISGFMVQLEIQFTIYQS